MREWTQEQHTSPFTRQIIMKPTIKELTSFNNIMEESKKDILSHYTKIPTCMKKETSKNQRVII